MNPIQDALADIAKKTSQRTKQDVNAKIMNDPDVQQFLAEHSSELTEEGIQATMINLFEYCAQKDGQDKIMAGYLPKLYVSGQGVGIKYVASKETQMKEQITAAKKRITLIELPKSLREIELEKVDMTLDRQEILHKFVEIGNQIQSNVHVRGLYLSGPFGVGKTYMMAGLANKIAQKGRTVVFLHMPSFIAGLSSHFGKDNNLADEIKRLSETDVLILDDIGAESLSDWSRDDVLGVILQARMDNQLPTFFTSNLTMDELEEHLAKTKSGIDKTKATRLMERVRFLAKEMTVTGPNRRFENLD